MSNETGSPAYVFNVLTSNDSECIVHSFSSLDRARAFLRHRREILTAEQANRLFCDVPDMLSFDGANGLEVVRVVKSEIDQP